jgi:hypothetical protein
MKKFVLVLSVIFCFWSHGFCDNIKNNLNKFNKDLEELRKELRFCGKSNNEQHSEVLKKLADDKLIMSIDRVSIDHVNELIKLLNKISHLGGYEKKLESMFKLLGSIDQYVRQKKESK